MMTRVEQRSPRISYLETRAETPDNVGWDSSQIILEQQQNILTSLDPSPKMSETPNEKRTLKIGADPSSDFPDRTQLGSYKKQISKVFRYTL